MMVMVYVLGGGCRPMIAPWRSGREEHIKFAVAGGNGAHVYVRLMLRESCGRGGTKRRSVEEDIGHLDGISQHRDTLLPPLGIVEHFTLRPGGMGHGLDILYASRTLDSDSMYNPDCEFAAWDKL